MEDLRQNSLWLEYCRRNGNKILRIPTENGSYIYGILISLGFGLKLLKIQRAKDVPDWRELKIIKRRNWVVSTIIEPQKILKTNEYKYHGYKISNYPYLATKTIIVDLTKSVSFLWNNLSTNAKRLIKKNSNAIAREVSADFFLDIWKKNSKIWTLKIEEMRLIKKVLGGKAHFWVSFLDDLPQSGILLIETKDTANYLHSFTTNEGRLSGAHYKLVWEIILKEKKRGIKFFDFEGIYDKRWPQKRWLGFTEFKRKFGGMVVSFPGTFHKWF